MGLFSSSKKEKIVAIFDIGSGSVGGAIVKIPLVGGGIPSIITSVRTEIKPRKDFDFDMFMKEMLVALDTSVKDLYHKKAGAPEEIICTLASPWYLSETRVVKMSREKTFIFSSRLASDLINKEVASMEDLYKEKYPDIKSAHEMIEQHTMAVSLNGYRVIDPIGKRCKFLDMHMVISLSPKSLVDKMRDIFSHTFHNLKVTFSSFTLASYLAIRDKYINEDSYLLLDVSGEVTDVGIVTKGVLKSVLSFPFGKKTFYNYMCTKLEIELRDAKELFKLYSNNSLSEKFKEKVIPLFKSIENSWGEAFGQCINTLPRTLVLPSTIFLTADLDIKNWFAEALHNDKYIKSTSSSKTCDVVTLDGPQFLNMCSVKDGTCDPFLMIESIATMRKMVK